MDDKLKEAIAALAGYAAGRPPTTMDAFDPLKGVRFSIGGGDELIAFLTALEGETVLTQNERERVMSVLSFAEQAMDGGEPLVTGFVNEKLEPDGTELSVREASFVQMLASSCWGIVTRPDEPMPREARAPQPTAAAPMDPSLLPSLATVIVTPTTSPPAQAPPLGGSSSTAATAQAQATPPAPKTLNVTVTGPDDPKWVKLRRELLDPLFDRRDRAEAAGDDDEVARVDEEFRWIEAVMLHACVSQFVQKYGYDNGSRVRYYVVQRQNGFHAHDPEKFRSSFGPVALMV